MITLTTKLHWKLLCSFFVLLLGLNISAYAQEKTKESRKVIIITKKVDKDGRKIVEKRIVEGSNLDETNIDLLIKEAKEEGKEIDIEIIEEITSVKKSHKIIKKRKGEDIEAKLEKLGIELPALSTPKANYLHAVTSGKLVFLAGKGPKDKNGNNITGKLGEDLSIEQGYHAARRAGIRLLAALKEEIGDLNKVVRIVKVKGMVNATPDFVDHSKVINGFSDLMVEVFGENGKHARAAVGMNSLPGNIAVEIEVVIEIE